MPPDHAGEARARSLVELGRWAEARDLVSRLLTQDPDRYALHGLMTRAHLGVGDPRAALACARRMVAIDPDGEWGHRLMSIALLQTKQRDAAVRAAEEAVRLAPNQWQTHHALASALLGLTPLAGATRARPAAVRAIKLAPHEATTHFTLGLVEQRLGNLPAARESYREALRLDPQEAAALNNLSMIERSHRFGRQLRGYSAALRSNPQGDVAAANLVAVTQNLIRRLYGRGLAVLVAGIVLTGFGTIGPNPVSIAAGVVALLALAAVLRVYVRATSRGVRQHVRSQLSDNTPVAVAALSTIFAFAFGLLFCFVPDAARDTLRHGPLPAFMAIAVVRFIVGAVRSDR